MHASIIFRAAKPVMSFFSDRSVWECAVPAVRTEMHTKDKVTSERFGIGIGVFLILIGRILELLDPSEQAGDFIDANWSPIGQPHQDGNIGPPF
jgi:hypothetical protein